MFYQSPRMNLLAIVIKEIFNQNKFLFIISFNNYSFLNLNLNKSNEQFS
jgi:hypothetical protein